MSKISFRPTAVVMAALILSTSACGGAEGDAAANTDGAGNTQITITPGGDPDPGPPDVEALNFEFAPATFTVAAGTEIQWVNNGTAPHTVTGDTFDSGVIRPGNGYRMAFDTPGTYEYWCSNHPDMEGTIVVE